MFELFSWSSRVPRFNTRLGYNTCSDKAPWTPFNFPWESHVKNVSDHLDKLRLMASTMRAQANGLSNERVKLLRIERTVRRLMRGRKRWQDLTKVKSLVEGRLYILRRTYSDRVEEPAVCEWSQCGWRTLYGSIPQTHAAGASIEVWC